jgi:alpha-glucosidase
MRRYTRTGPQVLATMREFGSVISWQTRLYSWLALDSHDTARIRTVVGDPRRHEVAVGLQMTLPGQPLVFAGDEFGLTGWNGEASRTPMPWNRPADRDDHMLEIYRRLIALRRAEPALRDGGLRWVYVDDDALVYLREAAGGGAVLIAARRAAGPAITLPGLGSSRPLYGDDGLEAGVIPAATGPSFAAWRL